MNKTALLLFSFLICFTLKSIAQVTEKNYKIYSVKEGKEVTLAAIADAMKDYDVLFLGEEHNDSVAHYIESKMLALLYEKYKPNVALSLEMFDRDVQLIMDEYLGGFIREKNFTKDSRAWSNYKDYKPMIEFSLKNKIDVVCANAPSRYTNLAGRKGQAPLTDLSKQAKTYFAPLPYDTASGKYYEKLTGVTSHTSPTDTAPKPPPMAMGNFNFVTAQSLWDATMAYSIATYLKKNKGMKVLQVNGRFHSDEGFAIVTQLKKYNAKLKPLIVSMGSDDSFQNINWDDFKQLGDYIIITDPTVPKTFDN